MRILFYKKFEKQFAKLTKAQALKYEKRISLFLKHSFDPQLDNHAFKGEYQGYRSIDIAGDLRVIFEPIDETTVRFMYIRTHSELYS